MALTFIPAAIGTSENLSAAGATTIMTASPTGTTERYDSLTPKYTNTPAATISPTETPTPSPSRTATLVPAPTVLPPITMVEMCGVEEMAGQAFQYGTRALAHLANGDQVRFCYMDGTFPKELRIGLTILGSLPQPERLVDEEGRPFEYLGIREYAFTWKKRDGSVWVLPALYPLRVLQESEDCAGASIELAPVLKWSGVGDKSALSGWQLDLVDRRDGKTVWTIPRPFLQVPQGRSLALYLGRDFQYCRRLSRNSVPPHYEWVSQEATGTAQRREPLVGVPLHLLDAFEPSGLFSATSLRTLHGTSFLTGSRSALLTLQVFGSEIGFIQTVPVRQFLDRSGRPLAFLGVQGPAFVWMSEEGREVVLPAVYPGLRGRTVVAPVFLCPLCADPVRLDQWQVWLVDVNTGQVVDRVEAPFQYLDKDQGVVLNSERGALEVVDLSASVQVTVRRVGAALFEPPPPVGIVEGIALYRFPEVDAGRLQDVLNWMRELVPEWHQYLLDQKPFHINWDPDLARRGAEASSGCCDEPAAPGEEPTTGIGSISFAFRPESGVYHKPWFAWALIHEATHIRDLRAQKWYMLTSGVSACRAAERSAVEMAQAYLIDLLHSPVYGQDRDHALQELEWSDQVLQSGTFDWNPSCRSN